MAKKWYVVYRGHVPGVYDEWNHCQKQVNEFLGNSYKGYKSKEVADAMWMDHLHEEEMEEGHRICKTVRKREGNLREGKTFVIVISILLTVFVVLLYLIVL